MKKAAARRMAAEDASRKKATLAEIKKANKKYIIAINI